ncbi:hypothetical protein HAX54_012756 [Datura stramonium]|uniref:Uncharacterized protein n=1 Tax=Datura stramonium TaxID=4076 RepID=A0ABS8S034_DATST|nr:hypothetical protein [Datura stramonium]
MENLDNVGLTKEQLAAKNSENAQQGLRNQPPINRNDQRIVKERRGKDEDMDQLKTRDELTTKYPRGRNMGRSMLCQIRGVLNMMNIIANQGRVSRPTAQGSSQDSCVWVREIKVGTSIEIIVTMKDPYGEIKQLRDRE